MKRFLTIAAASALMCNHAFAQQAAVMPTPSISATSPLGMGGGNTPVGGTGIPLGATEIASPGVSPMPASSTGTIGSTVCSTIGIAPSTMFGSANTFDGGGVAVAAGTPMSMPTAMAGASTSMGMSTSSGIPPTSALIDTSGTSSMCGAGSGNLAASSTPTSPTTLGGIPRTGIPLGSTEIGNLGVSSAAAVPTIGVTPTVGAVAATIPTMPTLTLPAPNATTVPPPVDAITTAPNTIPGL